MRGDTFTDRRLKRDMDRFKGNPKEEKKQLPAVYKLTLL